MRFALLATLFLVTSLTFAQTNTPSAAAPKPTPASKPASAPKLSRAQVTAAELQKTVDQLTQSNRDLLDLLKQQQAVLEDIQYDRRLQSRQIQSLEERLADALADNNQLQNKVAKLEANASVPAVATAPTPGSGDIKNQPQPPNPETPAPVVQTPEPPPPPPSTYLPDPEPEAGPPGIASWHRLFTLKGDGSQQGNLFQIRGKQWRVQWHNLDKPGKAYANTSALFISAFPKDDTIPQKVCAKLGTGGDEAELQGPGNYYLKIEASGGSWELAVEDFR